MNFSEIISIVTGIGLFGGLVALLFYGKNGNNEKNISEEEFEFLKRKEKDELEKKSANVIVNNLDNTDDISKIKSYSNKEFDNIFNKHKKKLDS